MMNKPKKHDSSIIGDILANTSSYKYEQTRTKMLIAARIGDRLKVLGWTNKNLAEEMSKQPSEVTKWLSGTHNFTVDTLVQISDVLGVKLSQLMGEQQVQTVFKTKIVIASSSNFQSINSMTGLTFTDLPQLTYHSVVGQS